MGNGHSGMKSFSVNLTVFTKTEAETLKAAEVLSRTSVGLALEGLNTSIGINSYEEE